MSTNATVEARHKDEAAKAAGYRDWTHGFGVTPDQCSLASLRAHAQALANLEAARAENADLTNRLAEIARLLATYQAMFRAKRQLIEDAHALASGHTPSSCPSCAAKDEAMAEIDYLANTNLDVLNKMNGAPDRCSAIRAITSRFITPPADPVAEALKALIAEHGVEVSDAGFDAMLAWHKSRLEGAKWSRLGGAK